ncbi:glutathione S-transferase family protein [Neptuniibacter sp. SY11_33]|uniref:glutathione S-transferase family protein n=1 Tax=Neptuniibacter sp. SY11_33 TaxID=3398215 RepID=UPI0039F5E8E5
MQLIIGNKNYSSWSLRAWLMLKAFEVEFDELKINLFTEEFYETLKQHTPVAKVPVLHDGELNVWDSLAICEYVNERYLDGAAWPSDMSERAKARAIVSEMHSGFNALRNEMPMNCRAKRKIELSPAAQQDIQRMDALWAELIATHKQSGPWLFGSFTIVDVFFAPAVLRFLTYGIELSPKSSDYVQTVLQHPALQAWISDALQETEVVDEDEAGEPLE